MNPSSNPYRKKRKLPVGVLGVRLPERRELPTLTRMELEKGEPELCYMLPLWIGGGHIVNLGDGASATLFGLSLRDHDLKGHVTSIDSYDEIQLKRMLRERQGMGLLSWITLHNQTTEQARPRVEPCNLLFVDADHSYTGVSLDLRLYLPLVTGYVALHDTNQDDVARAILYEMRGWEMLMWVNRIKVFRRAS